MDLLQILYPRVCPVCGQLIPINRAFCACSDGPAQHVPADAVLCSDQDPIRLAHICAPYYYEGIIRQQLLGLKFHNQTKYVRSLSFAMAQQVSMVYADVSFDCVTFVPMAQPDIRTRAFNQSALLAQSIAKQLFIQCSALLEKTQLTVPQHTLNQSDRLQNLEHVFEATDLCKPGSTVLLVDDIKTTGTTLYRCCEALKIAGVQDVYCVCAAVTRSPSPDF